uniref:t-SNARE coiled-coil homology domain-containing protein n=1 Tax=Percolomonas cosmopolitus TaxID=63605 RepID=A0A6U0KHW1_9EUKA
MSSLLSLIGISIKPDTTPTPHRNHSSSIKKSSTKLFITPSDEGSNSLHATAASSNTSKRKGDFSAAASSLKKQTSSFPDLSNIPKNHPLLKHCTHLRTKTRFVQQNASELVELDSFLSDIQKGVRIGEELSKNVLRKELSNHWTDVRGEALTVLDELCHHEVKSGNGRLQLKRQQYTQATRNHLLDLDHEIMRERNEALQQIEEDTRDIVLTTQTLNSLVLEKGEKQQYLEQHLSNTHENVRATTRDIITIEREEKKYSWGSFFGLG